MIGFRPPRVFGPCMFSVSVEAFDRSLSTENLEISRTFAVTADFASRNIGSPFLSLSIPLGIHWFLINVSFVFVE